MDEERLQPDSVFLLNQNGRRRLDNGGGDDDRLSELPNEILFVILSLLPVRRAASTTVLSSRWLDLWKQIPDLRFNLESDRISQLPDRIISDILSFLPLKKAAATSVLSSRWSNTWKHTPNLDFDYHPFFGIYDSTEAVCKCMEVVNLVLQSHKALSLKLFTICLYVDKSAKWAVIKWLEFVFMRKVEILELNFCCFKDQDIVVLKELLRELNTICGDPRTLIFFQSLKSLHLASLEVSGEDIQLFLGNCPLLESLSICFANLTSDIEVCNPMLKRLELYECRGGKSIKVAAPNLAFIRFSEGAGKFLYENVPRLVKASFAISTSEFVTKHLASFPISILQFLNIYLPPRSKMFWTIAFPQMPNLKKLSVVCFETCVQSLLPVTHVIWAAPRLEEFRLQLLIYREEPHMQGMTDGGRSPHQHLKVFHLDVPYDNQQQGVSDHVVELLTYVGNNCVALRRMEVVGPNVPVLTREQLQSQLPDHVQLSIKPPWYR